MSAGFPFSALVGQDDLRAALLANAVNPAIGGVLVRGERGTAKSTAVRSLARLLPEVEVVAGCAYSCDPAAPDPACPAGPHPPDARVERRPVRIVELPVGASTDRLAGSLDVERALLEGVRAFEPGLLAAAHRGILYVDEVNLLADHLVDLLLDAAALGVNYVEREGVSVRHPARFLLVGTMNPEEGDLRPQLLDRFGVSVEVRGSREPAERAEIVRRQLAFERDPRAFAARFEGEDAAVRARIRAARAKIGSVRLPDRALRRVTAACALFEVDGLRADIVTAKAALALAALDGRDEVGEADVRRAALLALAHRRRRGPLEQPGIDPAELDRAFEAGDEEPPPEPPDRGGAPPGNGRAPGDASPAAGGAAGGGPEAATRPAGRTPSGSAPEGSTAGARLAPGSRVDAPEGSFSVPWVQLPGTGRGAAGRRSRAESEAGRPVGDRPHEAGAEVAVLATLRAAAPSQRARGRAGPGLVLARGDLRAPVREGREGNLVLFVVDASGSMAARRRMRAVKGCVLGLLVDAYQRRDRVGLVAFRGEGAETVLPPTGSVELAARRLEELATGGLTPLAAGLDHARSVLRAERVRDPRRRALAVLVTDGRANAARGKEGGRPHASAQDRARRAAEALARDGVPMVVVDSEEGPLRLGLAHRLAESVGAPVLRLDELGGEGLATSLRLMGRRAA